MPNLYRPAVAASEVNLAAVLEILSRDIEAEDPYSEPAAIRSPKACAFAGPVSQGLGTEVPARRSLRSASASTGRAIVPPDWRLARRWPTCRAGLQRLSEQRGPPRRVGPRGRSPA
jgi:hypothetical protein